MTAGGSTVADRQPVAEASQSAARTAMAGLIGNVLEWFDFAVYGYFASDIGRLIWRARTMIPPGAR